jgi:hypothetical protein
MATWTDILDSETDPDKPITSSLGKRWANNVVAAFEGASGAERLDEAARGGSLVGDTVLFQAFGKSNTYTGSGVDETSPWVEVPGSRFRCTTPCALRATCTVDSGFGGGEVRVVKNGTEVTSATSGSLSTDLSMTDGDTSWFEVRGGTGSGGGATAGEIVVSDVAYRTAAAKRSCGGI